MRQYTVVVGNVGTVYQGDNIHVARAEFAAYKRASRAPFGRASGEFVVLMEDDEIIIEHFGRVS